MLLPISYMLHAYPCICSLRCTRCLIAYNVFMLDAVYAASTTTTQQQQQQPPANNPMEPAPRLPPAPPPLPGSDGRPVRASYQLQLQVQALLMTMTDEQKSALGHSETDLIVDCEFAGTTCTSTYVRFNNHAIIFFLENSLIFDAKLGACFLLDDSVCLAQARDLSRNFRSHNLTLTTYDINI